MIQVTPEVITCPSGPIDTYWLQPEEPSGKLAVVLPGARGSYREPLQHYTIQLLLRRGFRVIAVNKVYGDDPKWTSLPTPEEARRIVAEDAQALFAAIDSRFPGATHTLVGRSLGTYAIACMLERDWVRPRQIIWQTPALADKWQVMEQGSARGLSIIGRADPYFQAALPHLPTDRVVVDGADHGLEIDGDVLKSMDVMKEVVRATADWLDGQAVKLRHGKVLSAGEVR
jgi:hypothetical protein